MSPSEHKLVFRRLIEEAFNGGRLAILDEVLTSDFAEYWSETADLLEQLGIIVT